MYDVHVKSKQVGERLGNWRLSLSDLGLNSVLTGDT